MEIDQKIRTAARWVQEAPVLLITAGAGMGVDSGLPDFRGNDGLWNAYPPLAKAGWSFSEAASPAAFWSRPELAWGFYAHRLAMYRCVQPHAGFDILLRWARQAPEGYRVFTSNVDGHFQKAGFDPSRIVECHGSIHEFQCLAPCCEEIWSADVFKPEFVDEAELQLKSLPHCPRCGELARPRVLMFNDADWIADPDEAQFGDFTAWAYAHRRRLLVIELGAGKAIPTVRIYGERYAHRLIRINMREAGVRSGGNNLGISGAALELLQKVDEAMCGRFP
ncbi:SIR2 family NAD-dependent protein deacylase [Thauera sp. SDU_THAU2]|uniref:SIR2 family NAD-dependent protein deacylase n=1 Tax=Thauera sp. SDU_THAU2 TaxID=3136633 RepID=UPI00311E36FC